MEGKRDLVVVLAGRLVVVAADDLNEAEVGTRGLVVAAGQIVVVVGMTLSHLAESLVEADLDRHSLKMIAPPPCSSSRC